MPEATRDSWLDLYFFEGCEEQNDQPPPLEKVDASSALCEDEDLGGLGEALLKEIAEAVQVWDGIDKCAGLFRVSRVVGG